MYCDKKGKVLQEVFGILFDSILLDNKYTVHLIMVLSRSLILRCESTIFNIFI